MHQRETMMIPMTEKGYGLKDSAESLVYHLMRKLQNPKVEYPLIPELDIYRLEPEDLISMYHDMHGIASGEEECYFFYPLHGRNGSRSTQEGFWHSTGNGRKAQETDQTKWTQRNLVYYRGSQSEKVPTDWAMQEYVIESDLVQSFCLCYIHKKRRNRGSNKAGQLKKGQNWGSNKAGQLKKRQKKGNIEAESAVPEDKSLNPASGAPIVPDNQNRPEEESVDMVVEPQTRSSSSDMNVSADNTSSLMQQQLLAQEGLLHSADALKDSTESGVFSEPQFPQMYVAGQSPHFINESFGICSQQHGSWQYPLDITSELQNNGPSNFHSSLLGQYPQHVFAQSFSNESPNFRSPQYQLPDVFAQSFTYGSPDFQSHHYHLPDVFGPLCNYEMRDLLFLCFQYLQDVYARWLNDESLRPILVGFFHLFCFIFLKFQYPPQYQNPQDVSVRLSNSTPSNIPSPPHYPLLVPMEEIFPFIGNGYCDSVGTTSQVGYYGQARAEMPSLSNDHGGQGISSQEYQQFSVSSQTPVPLQNCDPCFFKQHISNVHSDGFVDSPNALSIAQNCDSQQTNRKVTQDSATESSEVDIQCSSFNPLDFLLSSPMNLRRDSSSSESSAIIGGHSTEDFGVPYPQEGICMTPNPNMFSAI